MALPASQYRTFRDLLRTTLSVESAGPSDGDVLSFFKQLLADSNGATALSASRNFLCQEIFRRVLSGNASNPSDADVVSFWQQLATDASSAVAMGATTRYQSMRNALRGAVSCDFFNPTPADIFGYFSTYAAASTPLTIITSTTPKLWLDSQLGAGANTWVDQSASGFNATEATNPPTLTTLGTVPCYVGNGSNQLFTMSGMTLTLGNWYWMIARQVTWVGNASICGGTAAAAATVLQDGAGVSPAVSIYNGGVVDQNPTAMTVGSWFRIMFRCNGDAGDFLQVGPIGNKVSGSSGGLNGTGWQLFCRANTAFGNVAIANVVVCPAVPTGAEITALDAWYAAKPFGGVVTF